jgi:hypothetical protein
VVNPCAPLLSSTVPASVPSVFHNPLPVLLGAPVVP